MKSDLSKVYLDGSPIALTDREAKLPLSRIVRAGGQRPERVDIVLLKSASDPNGQAIKPGAIIDRAAAPTEPIYLRSAPKAAAASVGGDRVIDQLGAEPRRRAQPHVPGVFQSPSQAAAAEAPAPDVVPVVSRRVKNAEALAAAEAEAEQRQEEDREQEGALQDEQDDLAEADDDAEFRGGDSSDD